MFRSRAARRRLWLPTLTAAVVMLGLASPVAALAATGGKPPAPSLGPAVHGVTNAQSHFVKPPNQAAHGYKATATAWPAASSGSVTLASPARGARAGQRGAVGRAARTPFWAQAVAGKSGYAGPRSLGVRVLDHAASQAAGVTGAVFSVTPATTTGTGSGTVQVGFDYKAFAQAYGGNFGSRLSLVRLPSCALTTPGLRQCQVQTPLATVNDPATGTLSAQLPLAAPAIAVATQRTAATPALVATPGIVLAATTSAGQEGGAAGSYAATSLKPSGTWAGGGSTGGFTYDYPVTVPPAASSLMPQVGLAYDSSSVDGQTSSTQAQASWAGDGWSTEESFIEQSFTSCADDPEASRPRPRRGMSAIAGRC